MRLRLAALVVGAALLGIAAGVHGAPKRYIVRMSLHVRHNGRQVEVRDMADRLIETTWVGTTTNAALSSNWSNGVPDDHSLPLSANQTQTTVVFDRTSRLDAATGFGWIRAIAVLTGTANFANGETVEMDGKIYTFVDPAAPSADGEVNLGVTLTSSLTNLFKAINLSGTVGSTYSSSMTLHETVTALNSDSTQLLVAYKDAGTVGNGKVADEAAANASWDGNFADGFNLPDATIRREIYIDDYPGSIMTAGNPTGIQSTDLIYIVGTGEGTLYIAPESIIRIVVNSPNYALALALNNGPSQGVTTLEIIRGRVELTLDSSGQAPRILVSDVRGLSENLHIVGTPTGSQAGPLIIAPGFVTTNGPDWDTIDNMAGFLTIEDGAVDVLRSTGRVVLKSTDTMTVAYIMGGELDTTQGSGAKTVTNVWVGPSGVFSARRDIDNFTEHLIGRK